MCLFSYSLVVSTVCEAGHWGLGCSSKCQCGEHSVGCDPVSGRCSCDAGFTGENCTQCKTIYVGESSFFTRSCCSVANAAI